MIEAARLVAISVPELRKLLTHLQKQHSSAIRLPWHWSVWRRHYQAGANRAPDQKRPTQLQLWYYHKSTTRVPTLTRS
jgi:hypothetical protein